MAVKTTIKTAGTEAVRAEVAAIMAAERLKEARRLVKAIPPIRLMLRDGDPKDKAQQADLACELAVHLLGWKPATIPKDARGENECEVLTETGSLSDGWVPNPVGAYARHVFIPKAWPTREFEWFAGIEEALAFARKILKAPSIRWSRDIGGTFILTNADIFEPKSGRSSSHCPSDAYAIIDAALVWIYHEADDLIEGRRE